MSTAPTDALSPSASGARRKRSRLAILAVLGAALAVGLLGAEGLHRLTAAGRAHDAASVRDLFARAVASSGDDVPVLPNQRAPAEETELRAATKVLHPYTGYDKVLALQHVADELALKASGVWERDYEVLVLGGSVAQLLCEVSQGDLAELIGADPRFQDQSVRLVCLGSGGFKQPQQVMLLAWLLALGLEPDAVLEVDGFNEVALGYGNVAQFKMNPLYPSFTHWGQLVQAGTLNSASVPLAAAIMEHQAGAKRVAERALAWHVEWSSLASQLARRALAGHQNAVGARQDELQRLLFEERQGTWRGLAQANAGDPLDVIADAWVSCSISMWSLCSARSIPYLHVLQPTLYDPGAKPITAEEHATGKIGRSSAEGVVAGYPRLREAGLELSAAGVPYFDASRVFESDERTLYIDNCHFNEEGNRALAEHVAAAFLASLPPL